MILCILALLILANMAIATGAAIAFARMRARVDAIGEDVERLFQAVRALQGDDADPSPQANEQSLES